MKRWLVLVGVAIGIFFLVWWLSYSYATFWWWIEVHTGTVNESGVYYGFWSGFGSDIAEIALIGGLITVVRAHNCHVKGCWRVQSHTTAKGHKLCKKHVALPNSELDLHPIHEDHVA